MDMKEIELLSELVNYRSFSDAAFSLAYSPSVISKYVSNIEKELGVKLFVRGNKANDLTLTPEGRVLISHIQKLNAEYQRMMEMCKQLKGSFENVLRVGSQSRFGNVFERNILASFLQQNPDAELEILKMSPRDLLKLIQVGKLDAMFISIHENTNIDNYFGDIYRCGELELRPLRTEREMYVGISEKYLPGIENEVNFSAFKDFCFALPFPKSADENDLHMINSFERLAQESGFKLKTIYLGTHDHMVLKLATERPIAVTTTNIPDRYEGVKFLKVSDWSTSANVYLVSLKSNRKKMLINLKKSITEFLNRQDRSNNQAEPKPR